MLHANNTLFTKKHTHMFHSKGSIQAYAMYRLPFADEINVIAQTAPGDPLTYGTDTLDGTEGFVMIPFDTSRHATVLIRPDEEMTIKVSELDETEDETLACSRTGTSESTPEPSYANTFRKFHDAVTGHTFEKLVLSRHFTEEFTAKPTDIFYRACRLYPRAMVYLTYTPVTGYWIGSTPEILIAGSKSHLRTVALAGTMPTGCNEWSAKNLAEQSVVARYIRNIISPLSSVVEEEGPYTSRAANLLHLKTEFHFSPLKDIRISDFIEKLHPTPAVCGMPKDEAFRFIRDNEEYDRSFYSGVIGRLNPSGETDLYVNLRCAHIDGQQITYYAGGGIMPDSTVTSEWTETELKMATMRSLFSH